MFAQHSKVRMTDGKTYMLKLKSSMRKSIWCACCCERFFWCYTWYHFKYIIVSSGEHLLQLCSQSPICTGCSVPCDLLSGVDFTRWRVWGKNCAAPVLLELSPRYSHASSFRDDFCYLLSEFGQKYSGLNVLSHKRQTVGSLWSEASGWQPGYSWRGCRMVLQVGAALSSFIVFLGQNSQVCGAAYCITID